MFCLGFVLSLLDCAGAVQVLSFIFSVPAEQCSSLCQLSANFLNGSRIAVTPSASLREVARPFLWLCCPCLGPRRSFPGFHLTQR